MGAPFDSFVSFDPVEEPDYWWGRVWARQNRTTLAELVQMGWLSWEAAALLWESVAQGRSVTIASCPSGAGKTTLLTSLLAAIPPGRASHFVRGSYETLEFLSLQNPVETTLLVSEISPHLPYYCWGGSLRRVLDVGAKGCQILSTIHASSVEEIVQVLASRPLSIPLAQIVRLGMVAFLDVTAEESGVERRVKSVARLEHDERKCSVTPVPMVADGSVVSSLESIGSPGSRATQ
jgi:hypothetical protein